DGGAEALGKADTHRVEGGGELADRKTGGDRGVPDAGAIKVPGESDAGGPIAELAGFLWVEDRTAVAVVGIFKGQQLSPRVVEVGAADLGGELVDSREA